MQPQVIKPIQSPSLAVLLVSTGYCHKHTYKYLYQWPHADRGLFEWAL